MALCSRLCCHIFCIWQCTMSTGHIETYEQIEIQTQRSWVCLWQGCISIAPRKISAASDNLRFIVILRRMQLDTVYSVYTVKHWSWVLCHLCCLSSTFIHLAQSSFLTIVVALSLSHSQFLQPTYFKCGLGNRCVLAYMRAHMPECVRGSMCVCVFACVL